MQPERELAVIRLAHASMRRLGVENPKVAVAGLNPHAGENGLFGTEDAERIAPPSRKRERGDRRLRPPSAGHGPDAGA